MKSIKLFEKLYKSLLLIGMSMPRMNHPEATRKIKRARPKTKILAFCVHISPDFNYGRY